MDEDQQVLITNFRNEGQGLVLRWPDGDEVVLIRCKTYNETGMCQKPEGTHRHVFSE